jgi:hypothetical protein
VSFWNGVLRLHLFLLTLAIVWLGSSSRDEDPLIDDR